MTIPVSTVPYKIELGATQVPVHFCRNKKARRYILRFQDGMARVTIPRGGTVEYAHEFARKNSSWIERQLDRAPMDWSDGTTILFRGEQITLHVQRGEPMLKIHFAGEELHIDPDDNVRCAVEARMRTLATRELIPRTLELARELGMEVRSVSVRNQRSRWGSCSNRKIISLNWRLIQTPAFVRDYIIVHELMHMKEMNHSPRFWAHVEHVFPAWRESKKWLHRNSALLR